MSFLGPLGEAAGTMRRLANTGDTAVSIVRNANEAADATGNIRDAKGATGSVADLRQTSNQFELAIEEANSTQSFNTTIPRKTDRRLFGPIDLLGESLQISRLTRQNAKDILSKGIDNACFPMCTAYIAPSDVAAYNFAKMYERMGITLDVGTPNIETAIRVMRESGLPNANVYEIGAMDIRTLYGNSTLDQPGIAIIKKPSGGMHAIVVDGIGEADFGNGLETAFAVRDGMDSYWVSYNEFIQRYSSTTRIEDGIRIPGGFIVINADNLGSFKPTQIGQE